MIFSADKKQLKSSSSVTLSDEVASLLKYCFHQYFFKLNSQKFGSHLILSLPEVPGKFLVCCI